MERGAVFFGFWDGGKALSDLGGCEAFDRYVVCLLPYPCREMRAAESKAVGQA